MTQGQPPSATSTVPNPRRPGNKDEQDNDKKRNWSEWIWPGIGTAILALLIIGGIWNYLSAPKPQPPKERPKAYSGPICTDQAHLGLTDLNKSVGPDDYAAEITLHEGCHAGMYVLPKGRWQLQPPAGKIDPDWWISWAPSDGRPPTDPLWPAELPRLQPQSWDQKIFLEGKEGTKAYLVRLN